MTTNGNPQETITPDPAGTQPEQKSGAEVARQRRADWREARRWWIKLMIQPTLLLAAGVLLIVLLGVVQRLGWISAGEGGGEGGVTADGAGVRYICP